MSLIPLPARSRGASSCRSNRPHPTRRPLRLPVLCRRRARRKRRCAKAQGLRTLAFAADRDRRPLGHGATAPPTCCSNPSNCSSGSPR
jgi:hypothetical protein